MTNQTPRGLRPHIVLAGPCNGGKSSLLNSLHQADIALVSSQAGTTTDPVYKNMELLPFGPVTFVDTPGLDDQSELGPVRVARSRSVLSSGDLAIFICKPSQIVRGDPAQVVTELGDKLAQAKISAEIPLVLVFTHQDQVTEAHAAQLVNDALLQSKSTLPQAILVSNFSGAGVSQLRDTLVTLLNERKKDDRALLENLIKPYKLVLMVVPIDQEAPAGRLILPQVQAIREVLDSDAASLVVKEREIEWALSLLKSPPDLAITDSQVVLKAAASIPETIALTTFSILFSRQKGDLEHFVASARRIDQLKDGDLVIIAETCSHKQLCDDIGRVKIPRWLRQYTGRDLDIQVVSGPLPANLASAKLVIHCGGCMITRRMMLSRLGSSMDAQVPITNYGIAISHCQGVLDRVIKPFGL